MQIRILPESSLPSIIFSLSLPELPPDLPLPLAWDVERRRIITEDLDVPRTIYAFDRSSWVSAIVQDVTFDMTSLTISTSFQDNSVEEWQLTDESCIQKLRSLLDEVRAAAEDQRSRTQPIVPSSPADPSTSRPSKHKKKGSLFHFVVSLMSSTTSVPSAQASLPPEPEVRISDVATELLLSQHPLRFRARSVLVDTYRRFVIGELKARLPPSGYTAWTANNMLRDTMDHMSDLVHHNGGVFPPPPLYSAPPVTRRSATHLFYDEDDEEADVYSLTETLSTDTDGSSLHTPLSTPVGTEVRRHGKQNTQSPGPSESETYHALQQQALQLRQLLVHVEIAHRNEELEMRQVSAILEVRSKRRAWTNRALCGGASLSDIGLATPKVSSPLARCEPITPETLEDLREYHSLSRRKVEFDTTTLCPVSEDDERLSFPGEEALAPPPLVRPRIRVRTHSSHQLPRALEIESPTPVPLIAPASKASVPAKLGLQRLFEDNSPFGDASAEFTIAVDANELSGTLAATHLYDDVEWVGNGAVAISSH